MVHVHYDGIEGLYVDTQGVLHVQTALGELTDAAPFIYQQIGGRQVPVSGKFRLIDADTYAFTITGPYDASQELVIDPNLSWSTYVGGSGEDWGTGVAVDGAGNALVTGWTTSTDFSGANNSYHGDYDVFVAKISSSGTLLWATYVGGSGIDYSYGIAVDSQGNALVTGITGSSDFSGANNSYQGTWDTFVAKVTSTGTLAWATYLGGDGGNGIAVDSAGNALVTGYVYYRELFPVATNTFQGGTNDAFVAKVDSSGNFVWATYLGGSGNGQGYGIAVDSQGNALVTGSTTSTNFSAPTIATSAAPPTPSWPRSIAAARWPGPPTWAGAAATRATASPWTVRATPSLQGPPVQPTFRRANNSFYGDEYDAFVAKVNSSGTPAWATYLGGKDGAQSDGQGIAVDSAGNALVTGWTDSTNFSDANNSYRGGTDAFVANVNGSGNLAWATYLGGSNQDEGYGIAMDNAGNVLVTGITSSTNFSAPTIPTTAAATPSWPNWRWPGRPPSWPSPRSPATRRPARTSRPQSRCRWKTPTTTWWRATVRR